MTNLGQPRQSGHHIRGSASAPVEGRLFERRSPVSGAVVARYADGTAEDVDRAAQAARAAFDTGPWPRMSGAQRAKILLRWARLIGDNAEELARLEVEEVGKTVRFARGDAAGMADLTEYAATLAYEVHGDAYTNLGERHSAVVHREPMGVVGLIVPWNFPGLIYCQKVPFALAAGNSVVVKPSEFTSATALKLTQLAEEAGVPAGVINVVTGTGPVVGQSLVAHPQVDMISFTGSTAVGRKVLEAAAAGPKRAHVELGSKAANIVFADADLEDALDGTLFGIFFNQGECCVSGARLLVQESIADSFVERLVARTRALRVGDPLDERTDVGALIHGDHLASVVRHVARGQEEGARLLTGGARQDVAGLPEGCFMQLTILDQVSERMAVFQQEIFGPVLVVTRFKDEDEAVALANASSYGLANAVWTRSLDTSIRMARRLRSGTVYVNTQIDGAVQLPFGGCKGSGFGREMGRAGLEEFTQTKSVMVHIGKRVPFFGAKGE
ncbi:MAG: aldehyde dehydrogenase family protein [Proteobacteria bacterium]|nr:aldehyde dehydrogenase family protein [Pseudomonadota bacterium]